MHVIAAKAVCFKEAMEPGFKTYAQNVKTNAKAMAQVFKDRGFEVVSNGTENHLFLVSFIEQGLTGKLVDAALDAAHITINKNAVPNDPMSPFVTSGIRVGTAASTTRGFTEQDSADLANWMCDVIDSCDQQAESWNEAVVAEVREKVKALCAARPVYK